MTDLLTAQEAAAHLRCHEKTVRRMILAGKLRATRVAGRYLIDPADLPTTLTPRPAPPAPKPGQLGEASSLARRIVGAA